MVKAKRSPQARLAQGDIIRDVDYLESVSERNGELEISRVRFPLIIVLTQDCDLEQDYRVRWSRDKPDSQDKALLSVLVAPLYNVEHVYAGEHLSQLGLQMQKITRDKTPGNNLRNNETPRYHYLEFGGLPLPPSVIDFKHYFSVNVCELKRHKAVGFVCQIGELFREDVSQRFANFLARIGLP